MQSSTAIAFRALVMLICLISIPLFAIFGRDLPEVFKNLLAGRLVVRITDSTGGNHSAATSLSGSTAGNAATASGNSETAPRGGAAPAASVVTTPPSAANPTGGSVKALAASSPGDWRADTTGNTTMQPAGFQAAPETRPISPSDPIVGSPSSAHPVNDRSVAAAPSATASPVSASGASSNDEQFRQAEARLRELGATHYTLETWGSDNNRYRFVCKMAIGGNPGMNRYFQAIEDNPWRAMNAVLQQVEAWRAQQPQQ